MNPHNLPDIREFRSHVDLQIRFNDIDILGHVNNTVYFSFYDTGKAYYLMNARQGEMDYKKVETVIANIDCAFIHPIFFGQEIEVYTKCTSMSDKSFKLLQLIVEKGEGRICSIAETVMVSIDTESKTAIPIPDRWRKQFSEFEGKDFTDR